MVQTGVLILGFALFAILFFTAAAVIYIPKALDTGHDEDDEESPAT